MHKVTIQQEKLHRLNITESSSEPLFKKSLYNYMKYDLRSNKSGPT